MNFFDEVNMQNNYTPVLSQETYNRTKNYLSQLINGKAESGRLLTKKLKDLDINDLTIGEFIELLANTKRPRIFAESGIMGNGEDWNMTELSILGDLSIIVPVEIYDNGLHHFPDIHQGILQGYLAFTPGALLRNDLGKTPADWQETTLEQHFHYDGYKSLYLRRLLPVFLEINSIMQHKDKQAMVTIPGLGCGQFAGKFKGQLGIHLESVLKEIISENISSLSNIKVIYFDPYSECSNNRLEIEHLSFLTRPLTQGNENKPQLCRPKSYQEQYDDFSRYELVSLVAWDHCSWPGNDFYDGVRATDDGVKAAATNSMEIITSIKGSYNSSSNCYEAPPRYKSWGELVKKELIYLKTQNTLKIY